MNDSKPVFSPGDKAGHSSRTAPVRDRTAGFLFAIIGGLMAPLMLFASRAPTVLMLIGIVGGAIVLWRRGRRPAAPDRILLCLMIGLAVWAGLTTLWAIDASEALKGTAKLAGNLIAGMALVAVARAVTPAEARLAGRGLAAGCILAAAFVIFEMLAGAPVSARFVIHQLDAAQFAAQLKIYGAFWFDAALSLLTLMIWPLLVAGRNLPKAVQALPLIVVAVLSAVIDFNAGTLSLVAGGAAAFLVWRGAWGGRLLAAALVLGILVAPVLPRTILQPERLSAIEAVPTFDLPRLYIWAFAAERVAERPLLGWGMNASRSMPGGKEPIIDRTRNMIFGETLPLHPHNVALQVWLELGLVGALLVAAIAARLAMFGRVVAVAPRSLAAVTGLTVTAFVQYVLSYGAWQGWWLASIFLAAAFLAIADRGLERD